MVLVSWRLFVLQVGYKSWRSQGLVSAIAAVSFNNTIDFTLPITESAYWSGTEDWRGLVHPGQIDCSYPLKIPNITQ
jgi:hypothetical protein